MPAVYCAPMLRHRKAVRQICAKRKGKCVLAAGGLQSIWATSSVTWSNLFRYGMLVGQYNTSHRATPGDWWFIYLVCAAECLRSSCLLNGLRILLLRIKCFLRLREIFLYWVSRHAGVSFIDWGYWYYLSIQKDKNKVFIPTIIYFIEQCTVMCINIRKRKTAD